MILELNDHQALLDCFEQHKDKIAAIIVEPLPANNGLLIQDNDYLKFLRELTEKHNALLIFDEVISGFRTAFGGMAELTEIKPDISTYGKIIGGGLPVGAIASTNKIMGHLAPLGNVYQAGTLSANPLAMIGGRATLSQLTTDSYGFLEKQTIKVKELFEDWFQNYKDGKFSNYEMTTHSSLFWIHPKGKIQKAIEIPANLGADFVPLFETLLNKGIYLSPNAYEVGFVSLAHNDDVITELKEKLWSNIE